jgi:hypothetical protein
MALNSISLQKNFPLIKTEQCYAVGICNSGGGLSDASEAWKKAFSVASAGSEE